MDSKQQPQFQIPEFKASLTSRLVGYVGVLLTGMWTLGGIYGAYLIHPGLAIIAGAYFCSRSALVISDTQKAMLKMEVAMHYSTVQQAMHNAGLIEKAQGAGPLAGDALGRAIKREFGG